MLKLAVVILNWNGQKYLEKFLPTLLKFLPAYAEVIIADNASTDHSVEFLKKNFPSLRIIIHDSNGGFSKGYNDALKQIEAEYYCLLNSDIEVTENWINPIMDQLDSNPQIAAVQPKIRSFSDREIFEYAGASGGFIDKFGYPFCRGRVFDTLETDHGQYDTSIDVFWVTGAALFVRSSVYHQLKGLDEDFFAHMEEIDFCWRIKEHGFRITVNPQSLVYHVGGGTLPKNNSFKTYLNFRNNLFLLLKNLPKNRLFITFFVRCILDNIAAWSFLLKGNAKDFTAVYKAHFSFLKSFRKMKRKRTKEKSIAYSTTYQKSVVYTYYIQGKKYFNGEKFLKEQQL